jgi:tetratricopeptide (TPR) repeat protein
VVERLAQLLGVADASAAAEDTFWAVRRLFESLAEAEPLVVDIDDVQWGETTFLDLIEHVADRTRDAPVLLLCSARPDLLDDRPTWGGGKRNATTIQLEPLSTEETERLAEELLAGMPPEVADRIASAAEGIPLFVEHLVAMLVEEGTLVRDGGTWLLEGDLAALAVPPTVSALIEARLERLPADELAILERASVEGKGFHRGAELELSPAVDRPWVDERLTALVMRDLIRPAASLFAGEDGFVFRHLLIRDAAYARISKEVRAEQHVMYAAWLEEMTSGRESELDEIVGYHLEQASRLRSELTPGDERAREIGVQAAMRLGRAGTRAFDRGDLRAAAALLTRADALLPPTSLDRVPILLDLGVVQEREGRWDDARSALGTAEGMAREAGDLGTAARAVVRRQFVRSHVENTPQHDLQVEVEALLPELEAAGDDAAIAEASFFLGISLSWLGQTTRAVAMLERAQELSLRTGLTRIAPEATSWIPAVMAYGPFNATEVDARWRALLASTPMSRYARAFGDVLDALSIAMMGDVDRGRTQWREARGVIMELGDETHAAAASMQGGYIELLATEFETARALLADGDETLERLGEEGYRSTVLCLLADAQQGLGRTADAIATTQRAERLSFPDDFETNTGWRAARARSFADVGEYEDAERISRAAIDVVAETDAIESQGRSWSSLGYVLASAGRTGAALEAYGQAFDRFTTKGNVLSLSRVGGAIATLRGDDAAQERDPLGAWGTTLPRR